MTITSQGDRGHQVGNRRSWGHCVPYTEPRAKRQREGSVQAREPAKLWFEVSFIQIVGKEELPEKGGVRECSIYTSKLWQGQVPKHTEEHLSSPGKLRVGLGCQALAGAGWEVGLRVPVPEVWAGKEGGGSFR